MVEIQTKMGVFLDIAPDADFEITIENPLMQDDGIPVPFSTSIAFIPTYINRMAFGYLDKMMLEPSVKSLEATIIVGGIPLFTGTLEYDSIDEDGRINYTFSGKDLEQAWAGKLYEDTSLDDDSSMTWVMLSDAYLNDELSGVHPPLIVNSSLVAEPGFAAPASGLDRDGYNVNRKYRNYRASTPYDTVPAVEVGKLIGTLASFDAVSNLGELLTKIVVLGTAEYSGAFPSSMMPDITKLELVEGICRMLCAAVFQDGSSYKVLSASDIFASQSVADWDDKIADICTQNREPARNYELAYDDDEEVKSSDSASNVASLAAVVDKAAESGYNTVKHSTIGDVYSLKTSPSVTIGSATISEILVDCVSAIAKKELNVGADDTHSVDIGFKLARCAPACFSVSGGSFSSSFARMAPVMGFSAIGSSRPTDVYIALYGLKQASDKGVVFSDPADADSVDATVCESITPEALYERYHKAFAAWIAKDRQVIMADVDLALPDIASFRMWRKVRVRSRNFLVRKLTVRLLASADAVTSTCELISL